MGTCSPASAQLTLLHICRQLFSVVLKLSVLLHQRGSTLYRLRMCLITIKSWFCGRADLKTGTQYIAICNLFGSVGMTLLSIGLLAAAETLAKSIADDGVADEKVKGLTTVIYVIGGFLLVFNLFYIILSSLLFHGAKNGKPSMILPWLILSGFFIFVQVIGFIIIWAYYFVDDITVVNAYSIIPTLYGLAVQVYIYIGISSYWRELSYGGTPPPSVVDTIFKSSAV